MHTVTIKNIEIGSGKPKVAASIGEKTHFDVLEKLKRMVSLEIDIIELRADYLAADVDLVALLKDMQIFVSKKILLFTLRTESEGGKISIDTRTYIDITTRALQSGCIDMIDIEYQVGQKSISQLICKAKQYGVYTMISKHEMVRTPTVDHLLNLLELMRETGGDILKIAAMGITKQDVMNLMQATLSFKNQHQMPMISISMGDLGKITRILGVFYGSDLTFAAYDAPSGSGQLGITETVEALNVINRCLIG